MKINNSETIRSSFGLDASKFKTQKINNHLTI